MSNKYTFRLTPLAEQDIDSALGYIAENLCNAKAAADLYIKIENAIDTICAFPPLFFGLSLLSCTRRKHKAYTH